MGGLPPGGKPGGTMDYKSSKHMAEAFGNRREGSLQNLVGKGFQYQADSWKKYDDAQATKKKVGVAKTRKEPLKIFRTRKSYTGEKITVPLPGFRLPALPNAIKHPVQIWVAGLLHYSNQRRTRKKRRIN